MKIKIFRCGLCKLENRYIGTRTGLREHLRSEHRIMKQITNSGKDKDNKYMKQNWWIVE